MDKDTLLKSLCKASYCTGRVELTEADPGATLKTVYVLGIPPNSLLIQIDNDVRFNNFLKPKLSENCGYNKHCDYLIMTDDLLIFIELKSFTELSVSRQQDITTKFISDICALEYSDNIFIKMLHKNPIFQDKRHIHILLYQGPVIPKTSVTVHPPSPAIRFTTPDTFKSIAVMNGGELYFKQLLA